MLPAYYAVVAAHVLLAVVLLLAYAAWVRRARPDGSPTMRWAARAQVLLGLVLVGLARLLRDVDLDLGKTLAKLVIGLAALACLEGARGPRRAWLVHLAALLVVADVLLAYLVA